MQIWEVRAYPRVPCCLLRGELEVAKNPVEQEEHHAHGPRSLIAKSLLMSPLCVLGHPSLQVKSWGQPPDLLQGLSPMQEKCLYPQGPERCCDVLASVDGTSGRTAPLLLPPVWSTAPAWVPVLPAPGTWHAAAAAVEVSCQKGKQWSSKCKLEHPIGWNEGASLAELWGQITQQLGQTPKASCAREEQDASCLAAGVPCPAAMFRQKADKEAGSLDHPIGLSHSASHWW